MLVGRSVRHGRFGYRVGHPACSTPNPLPEVFVAGGRRIVIAKRPETVLPSLDRAAVYGQVRRLGVPELLIGHDELRQVMPTRLAERALQQSRGWPILLGRTGAGDAELARFLASELLAPMRGPSWSGWPVGWTATAAPQSLPNC